LILSEIYSPDLINRRFSFGSKTSYDAYNYILPSKEGVKVMTTLVLKTKDNTIPIADKIVDLREKPLLVENFTKETWIKEVVQKIDNKIGELHNKMMAIAATPSIVLAGSQATAKDVIPPEVDMLLLKIQLICLGVCVSAGVIMAMIAGFFRIIGLREEAKKRYNDAVMGMIQVLTAPAVLGIIATVVRGLLRFFPGYVG
jgi:hypothetical protein